jgi:hypothetical protein
MHGACIQINKEQLRVISPVSPWAGFKAGIGKLATEAQP